MSRAGKFIPGGGAGNKAGDASAPGRTAPIRAPVPGAPPPETPGAKKPGLKGSSLVKPVSKKQKLPILLMSATVFVLIFIAFYYFMVLPAKQLAVDMQRQRDAAIAAQAQAKKDFDKQEADRLAQQNTAYATLTLDSKPTGADVTIGTMHQSTPATFKELKSGTVTVLVHADGYQDVKQDVVVAADKPTDLGTITLVQKAGNLSLTSPQNDVQYTLTGPADYSHEGQIPDKLEKLPSGEYQLIVNQNGWKLPPVPITIHDQENVQKEIKFPYANVAITSVPAGATVRNGHSILGRTPLTLAQVRPGDLKLSVDLPPYSTQRLELKVLDFASINKQVVLQQEKDFIAASGIPMVWISDGNFWAGKYDVRQGEFETVAAYNPSFYRRPNRPVEQISWENAMAFCDKLTQYEHKAGKLPAGYHYTLPTESQWSLFSADADIDQAPMSRSATLTSTQDAGSSEPNKYGLYDTLGNVWEWCLDPYDDKGNHSLRGGSWLSSGENFPNADTRNAGGPKYSDKFTGFRVVLVAD